MTPATRARALVVGAAVLFSTGGAGIKTPAFDAAQMVTLRSGIAVLAILVWLRGRLLVDRHTVGAGVIYAGMITLFVHATKLTTAANAIFLQSAAPLYILVLAPRLIGEPIRRRDAVYAAAVVGGMALCLVALPAPTATAPAPALGNLLGILCGVAWALTLLALRAGARGPQRDATGLSTVVIGNLLACAASAPFAWPLPADAPPLAWVTLVYLGVVQIGVAYACLAAGVRHLPALDASLLLLVEPALNPLWAWGVAAEQPGAWAVVGGIVILAASGLKSLQDARHAGTPA